MNKVDQWATPESRTVLGLRAASDWELKVVAFVVANDYTAHYFRAECRLCSTELRLGDDDAPSEIRQCRVILAALDHANRCREKPSMIEWSPIG